MIYDLSCEVNNELYYQYHSSMEEQFQSALSFELRSNKFVFHSESVIELHYKGFPVKESKPDYIILPGGPNKFDQNIVVEVKHDVYTPAKKQEFRLQLFTYLNAGPRNNNPLTKKLRYGIMLRWAKQKELQISDDNRFAELSRPVPKPNMELWKSTNSTSRHKFELLKSWGPEP